MNAYQLVTTSISQRGSAVANATIQQFAQVWIVEESDNHGYSHRVDETLMFAAEAAPLFCLDVIVSICQLTDDAELLSQLAIGPLETLLAYSDGSLQTALEKAYLQHDQFRFAIHQCVLLHEEVGFQWLMGL